MLELLRAQLAQLKAALLKAQARVVNALRLRDSWKQRALEPEARISLPGRHRWPAKVERWRGLVVYYANQYAQKYLGRDATPWEVDVFLGVVSGESGGDPNAVCRVEWIGTPPPGYDPADTTTRASGLVQHVPAYFAARAIAAGFAGRSIFDVEANLGTAAWLIYHKVSKAPNFGHWPDAPNGALGSASKARNLIAPLYPEMA